MQTRRILVGHVLDKLKELPSDYFHCVVTSPPYWSLRNYSTPHQIWGGNPNCNHQWQTVTKKDTRGIKGSTLNGPLQPEARRFDKVSGTCITCNAWRGELGQEPTPDLFVSHLVEVFRDVKRVLRPDGTLWLNIADSYAGSWGNSGNRPELDKKGGTQRKKNVDYLPRGGWDNNRERPPSSYKLDGIKNKDLIGIPWMLAFALRNDGWFLRSDIIWAKGRSLDCEEDGPGNPMPESTNDRCTKSHEYVFMLTKSAKYFFDMQAVREPCDPRQAQRYLRESEKGMTDKTTQAKNAAGRKDGGIVNMQKGTRAKYVETGRNIRDVWCINTRGYSGSHFATMPEKLAETCIKAGASEHGCCEMCSSPYKRDKASKDEWKPTCDCKILGTPYDSWSLPDVIPCRVLDPFGGSGTTLCVAEKMGRQATIIELNPEYAEIAKKRCNVKKTARFT